MTNTSQQARVLIQIREMILRGQFKGGMRLREVSLAEQLGVSRTPVKLALTKLEEEGLVEALSSGGYAASHLTNQTLRDGVVLRGALEALAARLLAEQGLPNEVAGVLRALLQQGDDLLGNRSRWNQIVAYDDYVAYGAMNDEFHSTLMVACGNRALLRAWELNNRRPSASPSATLPLHDSDEDAARFLWGTHQQHHLLLDAITKRESMRAHALAEEHAVAASSSLDRYFVFGAESSSGDDVNHGLVAPVFEAAEHGKS